MSGESITGKGGEFLVTPRQETGVHSLAVVSPLDTVYEILDGSRFVVHDPLFPKPWIIGDGSRFTGLTDALVVDSLRHPQQAGNLQLVQDEPRAPNSPLGNWSVLDHQIGTAMLARNLGLPDAFQAIAAVHDATKPVGGHPLEWNFEGCGVDSMSDMMMPRYMRAAGVLDRLIEGGHVESESDGWVPALGMEFDWILKLNHTPPHAPEGTHPLNYPGRTGYLDVDRAQYIVGQAARSLLDLPTAQALIAAMEYHGETAGFGPQIVVNDTDVAEMLFKFQTLEAVYDWGCNLGKISDMLFCRQLISHEIAAEPSYHLFDQMWTTQGIVRYRMEADWDRNPLLSALHKIETAIADHIRKIYEDCMFNPAGYEQFAKAGLPLPEWLTIQPSTQKFTNQFEAIWPDVAPGNVGNFNYLLFDVHPGKLRSINPVVYNPANGNYARLLDLRPDLIDWSQAHRRLQAHVFAAIDVHDPTLHLTYVEKQQLATMHHPLLAQTWEKRKQAPHMPPEILQPQLQAAGDYVREFGGFVLDASSRRAFYESRYGSGFEPIL